MKKFLKSISLGLVLAMVGVIMCACVPSNLEKAEAKMEDAGYKVVTIGKDAEEAEGMVGGIIATKGDLINGVEIVTATLFDSKDSAKKFYEKWVNEEGKDDDESVVKQNGKWVYFGTETAIKDFEG